MNWQVLKCNYQTVKDLLRLKATRTGFNLISVGLRDTQHSSFLKSPSWTTSAATDEKNDLVHERSQLLDYWIWTQQFPVPFCEAHIKKCFDLFHARPFRARARSVLQSSVSECRCVNTTRSYCGTTRIPSVQSEVMDIRRSCVFLLQLSPKKIISVDITLFQTKTQGLFT